MEWDLFSAIRRPVPPVWQWSGLAISVIAFVLAIMTLPTAFQMWWGRPEIKIRFVKADRSNMVALQCYIENEPIRSKLLRMLGVHRDSADIAADLTVRETPNGRQIVHKRPLLNIEQGEPTLRVTLAARLPAIFAVAYQMRDNQQAAIFSDGGDRIDTGNEILLVPGVYEAEVHVLLQDANVVSKKTFQIGRNSEGTYWLDNVTR